MGANECLFAVPATIELRIEGTDFGGSRIRVWFIFEGVQVMIPY